MFLNVLSLLVGFLCLFVVALMLFNPKPNRKTNSYLLVILFVAGLQRFLNAIEVLGFTTDTYSPLKIRLTFAFYIVPVYYLFFKRLIRGNGKLQKELMHFILPTVLVLIDMLLVDYTISYVMYLIFSCYYFGSILMLVKELIQMKKLSMFEKGSYKTIRTWALLMAAITFLLVLYSNYFLFSDAKPRINLNIFYSISSLLWLAALVYMFKNPMIIFGEENLLKSLQKNAPQDILIWNTKPLKGIEDKDLMIYNAIKARIDTILMDIQVLQKSVPLISTITLTAETLAKELKIPKSHLELIFKYYCHYSINDFSNLVKVSYSLSLIRDGYLENYTVAYLGEKCLFNSRFTFSKNFKKFTGVSVSDFVKSQNKPNGQYPI
jgi:AraC-like DNA-binding protein